MYLLKVHLFIDHSFYERGNNGTYIFYTEERDKLYKVLNLLKLTFLKNLSISTNRICTDCDGEKYNFTQLYLNSVSQEKEICEKCKQFPLYRICDVNRRKRLRPVKTWDLDRAKNYRFSIDIYDNGQAGCEEIISIDDIDNGLLLQKYKKSLEMKRIINIPIFDYDIKDISKEEYVKNIVYYNEYKISYSVFKECMNDDGMQLIKLKYDFIPPSTIIVDSIHDQ